MTVVHGTKDPKMVKSVDYIYTELLSVRDKHRLWLNCFALAKQAWFVEAIRKCDVVYIPRYCYPLIPFAKKLGKRVVVHLHDYQPISYNAVVFNAEERSSISDVVKIEILEHNSIPRAIFGAFTEPMTRLARAWLREADVLICVSRRQAEIISRRLPELASKIRVVYNPLPETPSLEEKFEKPTFTHAGGGSYLKGFYVFIQASLNLLKRGKRAIFAILGNLRPQHTNTLNRLKHVGTYKIFSHVPHEDALRLYSKSHAVLFPSICEEPLPYVVMESMAMGTIPIASRIGGIPEIVEGTYAERMLFTLGDAKELVNRIEEVLSLSKDLLTDIGHQLREAMLKKFDRRGIERQLLKIFEA